MANQETSMNFQFTQQGQSLATKAVAGTVHFDFTRAVASSDNHYTDTAAQASALTDINGKQQAVEIKDVRALDGDQTSVKIPVTFNKSDIDNDYQLLTIGVYAQEDGQDEVLYAVCGMQDPIYMHKTSNNSTYSIDLYVVVGTSSAVTLKVDPAGAVSEALLNDTLKAYLKTDDFDKAIANYATKQYVDEAIKGNKVVLPDDLTYADHDETIMGKWDFGAITKNGKDLLTSDSLPAGVVSLNTDNTTVTANGLTGIWVNQAYIDNLTASIKKQVLDSIVNPNTGKALIKMDFDYSSLTVDGDPVVPIVKVADEATATTREATHPNTQHEWSEE